MNISKLKNVLISPNTCNTTSKTKQLLIENI